MSMAAALERTAPLYERVRSVIPPIEWPVFADDIDAILTLKQQRNAVILAHNYQTPEIFHCVADIVGDSLALAREAMTVDADVIVLAGVHFMAETAKMLNPSKTVLIPDLEAGCSLAASITAADVRLMRQKHPGVPVVTYVNSSAAVKAESDICCTSANAKKVVESLGVPEVIMLPDEYLAQNVAAKTHVKIIAWAGHCEVHERFTPGEVRALREDYPGVIILAHPECPPDVVAEADFTGSTADMSNYVGARETSAGCVAHGMFDGRQRFDQSSVGQLRQAMQSLPSHEADHAAKDPPRAGDDDARGDDPVRPRVRCPPFSRTDARGRLSSEPSRLRQRLFATLKSRVRNGIAVAP